MQPVLLTIPKKSPSNTSLLKCSDNSAPKLAHPPLGASSDSEDALSVYRVYTLDNDDFVEFVS